MYNKKGSIENRPFGLFSLIRKRKWGQTLIIDQAIFYVTSQDCKGGSSVRKGKKGTGE